MNFQVVKNALVSSFCLQSPSLLPFPFPFFVREREIQRECMKQSCILYCHHLCSSYSSVEEFKKSKIHPWIFHQETWVGLSSAKPSPTYPLIPPTPSALSWNNTFPGIQSKIKSPFSNYACPNSNFFSGTAKSSNPIYSASQQSCRPTKAWTLSFSRTKANCSNAATLEASAEFWANGLCLF